MRKSKIIKIDDQEFTIKELKVRDIYELMGGEDDSMLTRIDSALGRCSDMTREQMMDMTPSDLQGIWEGFKEVNASFLSMAAQVGLDDLPGMLKNILQEQLTASLPQAMAA